MDESYLRILANEFRAGQDSFLIQLRIELYWDKDAFQRLIEAMQICCKHYQYSQEQMTLEQKELEQLTDAQLNNEHFADKYLLQKKDSMLPRWLASGFWFIPTFVREHTAHPYWEKIIASEPEYYTRAYKHLDDLASWFFEGQIPWKAEDKEWNSTPF